MRLRYLHLKNYPPISDIKASPFTSPETPRRMTSGKAVLANAPTPSRRYADHDGTRGHRRS